MLTKYPKLHNGKTAGGQARGATREGGERGSGPLPGKRSKVPGNGTLWRGSVAAIHAAAAAALAVAMPLVTAPVAAVGIDDLHLEKVIDALLPHLGVEL